jgi:hypothetical protein
MVVACMALLVSLGGTGYATVLNVPRNSVGTLELQRNAVKAAKIAPNAVRTGHVLDGTLLTTDFKAGQIPQGPKGDKGEKGEKGNAGATTVVVRWSPVFTVSGGFAFGGRQAMCNAGEVAVGGGGGTTSNTGTSGAADLYDSKPVPNTDGGAPTGWHAGWTINGAVSVAAYVICARP